MVYDFKPNETYQFFLQEAAELLHALEKGILQLQQSTDRADINTLMRTVHSIKGGSACVGLNHIRDLAHNLETVFASLAEQPNCIDDELEALLLRAYDCLATPLLEEIQQGRSDPEAALAMAQPVWSQLIAKLHPPKALAPRRDFPFSQDLEQGLRRLANILEHPNEAEMRESLRAQTEIFRGLGEIAQLPSLEMIAQTVLQALNTHPELTPIIGFYAQEDFGAVQAAIQAGNLTQGGRPSLELLAIAQIPPTQPLLGNSAQQPLQLTRSDTPKARQQPEAIHPIASAPDPPPKFQNGSINPPETDPATNLRMPSQRVLSVRPDPSRLDLLDHLVEALVTQDNQILLQGQQQIAALEVFSKHFARLKQLTLILQRSLHRHPSESALSTSVTAPAKSVQKARADRHQQALAQTTLQTVTEELARLGETIQAVGLFDQQFHQIFKQRQTTLKQIQTNLRQARMLPVAEMLKQFPRMVRDLSTTEHKHVTLEIIGAHTLVDKVVLEKLYDPLVHLIRNAIDHGIELPDVRQVLGKPIEGKITVRVWYQGNHTYLEVKDDGQGIDLEKVRNALVASHRCSPTEAANLSESRLLEALFTPGVSTAETVSQLSGRGVGLYAVQSQINELKGTVTIASQLSRGTTFTLRFPLSLTITRSLIFTLNGGLFAIPVDTLTAITFTAEEFLQNDQTQQFYHWKGKFVPLCPPTLLSSYAYPLPVAPPLDRVDLNHTQPPPDDFSNSQQHPLKDAIDDQPERTKVHLLLIANGDEIVALKIDRILMEQDLVIKPFNEAIMPPASLRGCTILGDGRLAPVLDGGAIVEKWLELSRTPPTNQPTIPISNLSRLVQSTPKTLLIIDDSLTMRHALYTTLSKAGYQVLQAKDGIDGLAQLTQQPQIVGIICDIEMPRMNGLEFLSHCRQEHKTLPIIMLTCRSSDKHRQLALQLGATEYLTKPYLDKDLLKTLHTCLDSSNSSRITNIEN